MTLMTPGGKAGWSRGRAGPGGEEQQSAGLQGALLLLSVVRGGVA